MRHIFPKIEKIAVDSTISHFLLMFGYKLFSAYFPLFLITRGLSLSKVGYTYLLIYLSIVVFAPVVGAMLYRFNPAVLSSVGILGYGAYALGMIYSQGALFDALQVLLGVSAALFFVASRGMLIRSKPENHVSAFGLFYSAPTYAAFLAPAAGAFIIWQFGFTGVFVASFIVHLLNIFFSLHTLFEPAKIERKKVEFREIIGNYISILSGFNRMGITPSIVLSFSVLVVGGFYSAFFILFLKSLGFAQDKILIYIGVASLIFIPISIYGIKMLGRLASRGAFMKSGLFYGMSAFLMGVLGPKLNLAGIFGMDVIKTFSAFTAESMRSGIISKDFPDHSEEAGVIDTILSPLGVALGAFSGGLLVSSIGYGPSFEIAGIFVLTVTLLFLILPKKRQA